MDEWLIYDSEYAILIILCLHDLPSLSPPTPFSLSSFVIRGIPIQWERSGVQMADLNERKNGARAKIRMMVGQAFNHLFNTYFTQVGYVINVISCLM